MCLLIYQLLKYDQLENGLHKILNFVIYSVTLGQGESTTIFAIIKSLHPPNNSSYAQLAKRINASSTMNMCHYHTDTMSFLNRIFI